jgi:hypothetical protein
MNSTYGGYPVFGSPYIYDNSKLASKEDLRLPKDNQSTASKPNRQVSENHTNTHIDYTFKKPVMNLQASQYTEDGYHKMAEGTNSSLSQVNQSNYLGQTGNTIMTDIDLSKTDYSKETFALNRR